MFRSRFFRPRLQRVKLIFNPRSGRASQSPNLLNEILLALQTEGFAPEVYLVIPDGDLASVMQEALRSGIRLFLVCGGDGTIEGVARQLIGKNASLAVVPGGTRNNVALSLGIPFDVWKAVELLRTGQRARLDVGIAEFENRAYPFWEVCSVGLFSALFDAADNLQRGDLTRLGDALSTLVSFPLADLVLEMDSAAPMRMQGHVVLVANMPYFGPNYKVTLDSPLDDGILDVLVFAEMTKLELVGNLLQMAPESSADPRIQRYQARKIKISSNPILPVHTDGDALGSGSVEISARRRAVSFVTGKPAHQRSRWGFLRNLRKKDA